MANKWTSLGNLPSLSAGYNPDTMILLSDGSVIVHNAYGKEWFRLTPDDKGNYDTGIWAGPFSMTNTRQFFSSGVLMDGRVFALGGEYSDAGDGKGDTPVGEIFDPSTNSWSPMSKPSTFDYIRGDASGCILQDGRVLFGALSTAQTVLWDPVTNDWREAGLAFGASSSPTKLTGSDEETWTLLPDGSVLAILITNPPQAQKYIVATDTWVAADQTPATLTQPMALINLNDTTVTPVVSIGISEIGPAVVLPDGRLFAVGGTGHTAFYTPPASASQPGSWAKGPDLPGDTSSSKFNSVNGNIQTAIDAPGVLLPCGKVLVVGGNTVREVDSKTGAVSFWSNPSNVYVIDPATNGISTLSPQPPSNGNDTWRSRFLLLPTGQVLFTSQQSAIGMLTVDTAVLGSPQASWAPAITDFPQDLVAGHAYTITGTQFNGLSQACSYGDDAQMATNFPIVRLTNTATSKVRYLFSSGFSTLGIATGNTPVSTTISIPSDMVAGQYNMVVIANGIPSASVTVQVATQDIYFLVDRSTYAQGEIQSMINANGAPAVINPALYVVVEGFKPSDLGLTTSNLNNPPNPPVIPSPASGISITFAGPVVPEDPGLPNSPQRFTFPYQVAFQNGDSIFGFGPSTENLTLTAKLTAAGNPVSASAIIELTKNPNPFILHGDIASGYPWYLSTDIKVFQVKAGQTLFNQKVPTTGAARDVATGWIQGVISAFNGDRASALSLFNALPSDENTPELALATTDSGNTPIYNFALARVRYRDTIPANNVRLFFRMWQAQQTNATYGNPTTLYPSTLNGSGQPIPLLGIQDDEVMTIPFFATPRVHTDTIDSMTTQTDAPNIQPVISPSLLGGEVDTYFGAWLDINQPNDKFFPDRIVGGNTTGPFTGQGALVSALELVRSEHQCLLAEISFDLDPIPANADPSNSDKLAQRNLAFIPAPNPGMIDSRRVPQTFVIRPTPLNLPTNLKPDELMIEWGNTPAGSTAQIYLPAAPANDILKLADQLYTTHRLTAFDAYTIACETGGVTYIPIPKNSGPDFAGLLTIDLPAGIKKGQVYNIIVKQVTSAIGIGIGNANNNVLASSSVGSRVNINWRRVLGVFHLTIPISTKQDLLQPEERKLSIMKYIGKSIPSSSKWFPVFNRYLDQLSGRVKFMGGDPIQVIANGNGIWTKPMPGGYNRDRQEQFTGKVSGLIYDHFGDFEGFTLETEEGREHIFTSREKEIEKLAEASWRDRLRITVWVERDEPFRPLTIILREPPVSLI